jgi:branched-chain amino acid transport system substrate-binding protein
MKGNNGSMKKNEINKKTTSRRRFVQAIAATGTAASIAGCSGVTGDGEDSETVKIGVVEDQSGNLSLVGIQKYHAHVLALEEINEQGGILGQEVEMIAPDTESSIQRYQDQTRRLINDENVDVLMGAQTSASREAIRPIVDENQQFYFYTNQYEGGVCDTYTWCTGAVPEQQITPVLESLVNDFGEDIYTIAADYNFGQITADWYRSVADDLGANIVGEEFIPLEVSQFGDVINRIQGADPDILVTLLVGDNHASFYNQKLSAGLEVPMSTTVNMAQGYEHLRFDPPALADMFVGVNYMQEIPTDQNQEFVDRFYSRWGDEAEYLGQMAQNAYFTMFLYKQVAEEAGTTDQDELMDLMDSQEFSIEAPEGTVTTDPQTHHVTHQIRRARADEDHEITFNEPTAVEPYWLREGPGCDLTEEEETTQYTI